MGRIDDPHTPLEAPASLWGYVAVSVLAALAQMIFVGGVITWVMALPSAFLFGFMLLHGLRVLRRIAIFFCSGSLFFALATPGPPWLNVFPLVGLVLLLLPASREFCAANSAAVLADT